MIIPRNKRFYIINLSLTAILRLYSSNNALVCVFWYDTAMLELGLIIRMPSISRSALVMYSVEQMFQLINDVHAYPKFLPDCSDSKIIIEDENSVTASLLVSKAGFKKWFTTKNTHVSNHQVKLDLVDGPFNTLHGRWLLTELSEEACKVSLELEYEFSNKMFDLAFGRVFNHLTNNMVQAFTQRAKEVYGVKI